MTIFLYPFLVLAGVGFGLSLIVHVAALLGLPLPGAVFALNAGIFAVWLPVVLMANFTRHGFHRHYGWKESLRGCPRWMRWVVYGLFVYTFLYFLLNFLGRSVGSAPMIRAVSGQWLVVYAAGFAQLYSNLHLPRPHQALKP